MSTPNGTTELLSWNKAFRSPNMFHVTAQLAYVIGELRHEWQWDLLVMPNKGVILSSIGKEWIDWQHPDVARIAERFCYDTAGALIEILDNWNGV